MLAGDWLVQILPCAGSIMAIARVVFLALELVLVVVLVKLSH